MEFDRERVRQNVESASTEDLIDRITVFRAGMEREAIEIIQAELKRRRVDRPMMEAQLATRTNVVYWPDGLVRRCTFCDRPAVELGWRWHWIFGKIPLFPRRVAWCPVHQPVQAIPTDPHSPNSPTNSSNE